MAQGIKASVFRIKLNLSYLHFRNISLFQERNALVSQLTQAKLFPVIHQKRRREAIGAYERNNRKDAYT